MKKLILIALITVLIFSLCGCNKKNDTIEILNKSRTIFDDILIDIKDGYFYDRHEKFTVDENTVGVTVYFTKEGVGEWELKGGEEE